MLKSFLALLYFPLLIHAQSLQYNTGERIISEYYDSIMESQLEIYIGKKFYDPFTNMNISGPRYYRDDTWAEGEIGFNGQHYSSIKLRYHIFLDRLIIQKFDNSDALEIPDDKINYFILHDTKFIFRNQPQPGYYALLYQGGVTVLCKYYSTLKKAVEDRTVVNELRLKQKYFIEKNEKMIQVKSKKSILKVFSDKNQDNALRKFLRREKIIFSQNKEFALSALGQEFDRLQN